MQDKDLTIFIENLKEQFVDLSEPLEASTLYKKLKSYDSMTALLIISMIDDVYNVAISGDDLRATDTIQDLFELVLLRGDEVMM